ncbi:MULTISPECIES: hypothetical protein [unclassified Microcoleus]|uniref:hypothetical protein n=1 Tax=unclassified Microcoleus TaxID=2642155 RepID=UPI0025FF6714|nr:MULTISPECIES: hypothetical protein [unclassified Microcoleus]
MILTLSAATVIAQIRPTVQSLPDGDYRYRDSFAIDRPFREIQFRKRDRYITGSDSDTRTGKSYCFRGFPQHNNIVNITRAIAISSKTAQQTQWKLEPGNPINFDKLYPLQAGPGLELYKCLTAFLPEFKESSVISH